MAHTASRPVAAASQEMVPRALVVAMFTLMLASLTLVTLAQLTNAPQVGVVAASPVVASRDIVLIGDRGGAYAATTTDGTVLAMSDRDKAGFIGVIGRVVERQRTTAGKPLADPITLQRHANGTLSISDTSTGMDIALIGYGADNLAAFARLID